MYVHAGAVDPEDRLGHEGGVQAVLQGHLLDHEAEGRNVVGGGHRLGVLEIDLVLAGGDLVVRRLDLEAHRLEHDHDVAPALLSEVDRGQVEVAAGVVGVERGASLLVLLEQKELGLRPGHHLEALFRGALDLPLERQPRTAGERRAVRQMDVADHARHFRAVRVGPGIDLEGVPVGNQQHVRFFDAGESLDRRAVEHDLAVEGFLELTARHLDVLDDAQEVGELESEEADFLLVG